MSTTPTITHELVADENKELVAVIQQNALPPAVAQSLQSSFAPLFAEAREIIAQSRGIVVTDASQKLQIALAGDCRRALKKTRVAADKLREELKRQSLRESNAVQGFYNIFLHLTNTEETRLKEQEDFVEIRETKRKEGLRVQRTEIMASIGADPNLYQLGVMSEETFQQLVEGVKLARAAAEQRRLKEEADRIAREAADLAERERVRLENERLKKEADEKEAALKVEREAAAAQRKKEQDEAFAKAEEIRKSAEAERARLEAIAAEERRKYAEEVESSRRQREAVEKLAADEKRQADAALAEQKRISDEAAEVARKEKEAAEAETARRLAEERKRADEAAAKIRSEADERARKAKVEADKRATILKEENDRVKAQLKAENDAQAKRKADAEEAERKAAAASAKDKLLNYANAIRAIEIPTDAQAIATVIKASRDKFCDWVEEKAGGL